MPKLSAGLVLFRRSPQIEVFLVHPGGPFWAKKDAGAWSIPKGEYQEGDDALQAARREFTEETSFVPPEGEHLLLGKVKYGNKLLKAWAVEGTADALHVKSNFFELEWPPKSGRMQQFPEVDKAGWFTLAQAQKKLVGGQVPLLAALAAELGIRDTHEEQMSLF
ncbi:MAG TPA: NUDIX domain-containing protein [Candidatus Saccharimonadales bacterium]|nr:NUDIX domain-containing protein [Candidatus Saccharimonadales bacterium]